MSDRRRPVVLVGLRGAGKTTVGRLLAARLGTQFRDLDDELARLAAAGRLGEVPAAESAGALLAALGEARFRELELAALELVLPKLRGGDVLAAGGGTLETEAAARLLAERCTLVWLRVDAAVAAERVAGDRALRPPLRGEDSAGELFALARERAPRYAAADLAVDAEGEVGAVAESVCRALRAAGS